MKLEILQAKSFHEKTSFLKISKKSTEKRLRKTRVLPRKIIMKKEIAYNNSKVFRRTRKTLIIRNRVKTICSQTSFGEHNYRLILVTKMGIIDKKTCVYTSHVWRTSLLRLTLNQWQTLLVTLVFILVVKRRGSDDTRTVNMCRRVNEFRRNSLLLPNAHVLRRKEKT